MKVSAVVLLVPGVLLLAACGPDRPEDVDVPPAAERVSLDEMQGSGTTGEVAVTPRDGETHIVVEVMNAPRDESLDVRLHSGTCQNPGPEIANIGTIRTTDDGRGAIDATVGHPPAQILDGNHLAVVWASADWRNGVRDPADPVATQPGTTQPADTPTAATGPDTLRQDVQQRRGLLRDDRLAIACTVLPRQ
jgi:hypothetical protein